MQGGISHKIVGRTAKRLWTPDNLSNVVAWYDAAAITGLSNNDPVSTWADLSSSGWNASSSNGNRPTYITNAQNSLPIVRFSGSNHLNLGSTNLFRNVGGGSAYVVTKDAAITTTGNVFMVQIGIGLTRFLVRSGGAAPDNDKFVFEGRRLDSDSLRTLASTQQVTSNWTLFGAVSDWTNSVATIFLDAELETQDTNWHSGGNTSNTATRAIGTCIGARTVNNQDAFNGDMAEIVVTHSALTTSERQLLEGYLAWKWGLEGNLPAGHPYKSNPPIL
jgi:hypothetical protein